MSFVQPADYLLYKIDWETKPKLSRSWYSNILSGMKGNEQRSMLRTVIRHTLEFTMCTRDAEMTNELKRKVVKNLHEIWGMPVWPYEMKLTQPTVSGEAHIHVDSTIGKEVGTFGKLIIGDWNSYDVITVSGEVSGEYIPLSGEKPSRVWPIGQKVYPMMRGEFSHILEFSQPTPYHFKGEFSFVESFVDVETPL
jgi:hypothetical protein